MLDKIIEIIMTILPFLGNRKKRKAMAQDVKEFSELVKDQYTFPDGTAGKGTERLFRPERESERNAHRNLFVERTTGTSCHITVRKQRVPTAYTKRGIHL